MNEQTRELLADVAGADEILARADQLREEREPEMIGPQYVRSKSYARIDPSDRELEVVDLVSNGATNAAIAKMLGLSVETVKSHMQHVLPKLGACNRAHAVALAIRRGLIPTTERDA